MLFTSLYTAVALLMLRRAFAQTFSSCNPLHTAGCPPDPALAKSVAFDFTKGPSDQFTARGNPTYGPDGVSFTIAKPGDSPQINSNFYIMFGKMEVSMKAAAGAGVVSSVVMQSDDLDEIDWEWLGGDPDNVQSNYFGKGQTTIFNRGGFHSDPNSQTAFRTYTIDWTADQIVWQIDGITVRALRPQDASGQYPQTPMQIKAGIWSGGDPSNEPGTIAWARGPTDYSKAPFTMQLRSLTVTDYSTGTQYQYSGQDGSWQSIVAVGGTVNPSGSGSGGSPVAAANAPAVTSASPSIPAAFAGTHRDPTATHSTPDLGGWSIGPSTLQTVAGTPTTASYPGLPSGWTVTGSGKVVPPSAAASIVPLPTSSALSPESPPPGSGTDGARVTTLWDGQGSAVVVYLPPGQSVVSKSYDERGFLVTGAPVAAPTPGTSPPDRPALVKQSVASPVAKVFTTRSQAVAAERGDGAFAGAGLLAVFMAAFIAYGASLFRSLEGDGRRGGHDLAR
ncbi:MAG: hypothetical protein M1826_001176 [Phylliscum demangeonii]|nr:MAG: hypothetical protein M1826_001176 [Phylliscum demangeonii]